MSFAYCVDDVLALIQLSWSAVEGARRACGKHDDLTKEVSSLYDVLAHVYSAMSVPESPIGQARRGLRTELQNHMTGCDTQLRIINTVLDKFNALSPEKKFGKQLWPKVRFANGEDRDLAEIRSRMATYSTAITMSLRLMSLGSRGKIERQLSHQKGSLEGIRESVNFALAQMNSTIRHQSLMVAYMNDSKAFWSRLRRELVKEGFSRSAINGKKDLILSYMKELDSRGVLGYSISFQKVMAAQNEAKRQSNTPASFQSSSTLTGGRNSNSSLQSFEPVKHDCSPNFDEPICIRTESGEPSWPDSRPVTAVEHIEESSMDFPEDKVHSERQYLESSSPQASLAYQVRISSNSTEGSRTLYDEPTNILTESKPAYSPSHHSSISSLSSLSRHRSMSDEMGHRIKLEDPHGREFSFPLSQAKTWEGMENLVRKNCAGMSSGIVNAHHDGQNILPYLWEEMAEPGAKLTIRRPAQPSQPSIFIPLSEEFYLLPERPTSPEDDFGHLPTLGDWMKSGKTEFTPHSEFYEMD